MFNRNNVDSELAKQLETEMTSHAYPEAVADDVKNQLCGLLCNYETEKSVVDMLIAYEALITYLVCLRDVGLIERSVCFNWINKARSIRF